MDISRLFVGGVSVVVVVFQVVWRVGFGCSWIQATATPGSTGPARRLRLALPGLVTLDVQGLAAPPKIDTPEGPLDLFLLGDQIQRWQIQQKRGVSKNMSRYIAK
ncbi:Hypothetical_protein [Hexamita inflata]|uniref:Hypothetical_protein n=1 Tax=Hexamita inflata TaxID=28002 RepID=A0AA86R3B3_9EUKA|nr:Hypothetical protein HINF_LOCUS11546 [Hexamita inflata]CAI9925526.1 Hypothetical protein HINF_LOCUS13171 [Hexamita inflata]CAI9966246.1 Hypothetical protein HINF_LOCUS53891 [Hexamita inflata]